LAVPSARAPGGFTEPNGGPADIILWVEDRRNHAVDLVEGTRLPPEALLDDRNAGVHRSEPDGLVLWALPRDTLDDAAREARMFAVESDLIIGAYASYMK
jgi:hypothetical protein